ncbi:hypothetical protein J7K52_03885 [Candidatus Bathyarchaeota archaeon]|nr:hypothetical protein [Candidatus Bathyarchaeota archaeon]
MRYRGKLTSSDVKTFDRRNRFKIMAEILTLCRRNLIQKTRIMYLCNLSYDQLQRYIDFLTHMGLLEAVTKSGRKYYQTTKRGIEFLEIFSKLEKFFLKNMEY